MTHDEWLRKVIDGSWRAAPDNETLIRDITRAMTMTRTNNTEAVAFEATLAAFGIAGRLVPVTGWAAAVVPDRWPRKHGTRAALREAAVWILRADGEEPGSEMETTCLVAAIAYLAVVGRGDATDASA